jgi:hypothetical protein
MKTIQMIEYGGPEVRRLVDRAETLPEDDTLLVDVALTGVDLLDIAQRRAPSVRRIFERAAAHMRTLDLDELFARGSIYVRKPAVIDCAAAREACEQRLVAILRWAADGRIRMPACDRIPLPRAPLPRADGAHNPIEARKPSGRTAIDVRLPH